MKETNSTNRDFEIAKSHFLKGLEFFNREMYLEAETSFRASLLFMPERESTLTNLSATLLKLNKNLEAKTISIQALELNNLNQESWLNLGNALQELKQHEQALASHDNAISIKPDYAEAWSNRGNALQGLKQFEQAIASYDKAISIKPDYAEAWSNRGNALQELKKFEQAVASYDKAISIRPDYAEAWSNRGNSLQDLGDFLRAVASYREAIRINPEYLVARSNLLFSLNYAESLNDQEMLIEAKRFGLKVSERAEPKFTTWDTPVSKGKLRVGLVSGDLRNHSVGYFVEGLLEKIDMNRFEIVAFPSTSITDDLTNRIKQFIAEWNPIYGMSDLAAATLIHQKGIHVLIDLSGHTAHNRLAVFSYKPAPVQVTWLGLPMTTGIPEMDYVLGDPHALPQEFTNQFTEAVWRLPESYLCLKAPAASVEIGELPAKTNKHITFGSFNNLSKMNDKVVAVWSKILKELPTARLLLKTSQLTDLTVCSLTQSRFERNGVTKDRLIFKPSTYSRVDHLLLYNEIDIALDTFPYPGVTTSSEAIWMGVPVLSLRGSNFLSCTAKSIAENIGLSEWNASTIDEYVNKAVHFSSDLDRLAQLRSTLRDRVLRSPLFDTHRFAKNFGDALWGMWDQRSHIKAKLSDE